MTITKFVRLKKKSWDDFSCVPDSERLRALSFRFELRQHFLRLRSTLGRKCTMKQENAISAEFDV
jgi:hypothetical protein